MSQEVVALATVYSDSQVDELVQLLGEQALANLASIANLQPAYLDKVKTLTKTLPEDDAGEAVLVSLLADGVRAVKQIEEIRKKVLQGTPEQPGPGAIVASLNELFRIVRSPLEAAIEKGSGPLERGILGYRREKSARIEREKQETLRRQIEAAKAEGEALAKAEAAKTEPERAAALDEAAVASRQQAQAELEAPRAMNRGTRTEAGSVSARKKWTFEIVKEEDIPRRYLMPNEKAIRAAVESGEREIPGVNIFEEDGLTRRLPGAPSSRPPFATHLEADRHLAEQDRPRSTRD